MNESCTNCRYGKVFPESNWVTCRRSPVFIGDKRKEDWCGEYSALAPAPKPLVLRNNVRFLVESTLADALKHIDVAVTNLRDLDSRPEVRRVLELATDEITAAASLVHHHDGKDE